MGTLFKDLLRRYWVMLAILAVVMTGLPALGGAGVVACAFYSVLGMVTVVIEQTTGAARVKTALPIARNTRARALWVQAVIALPLLHACVAYPVLTFWRHPTDASVLAFQLAAPALGMSVSALAFLLLPLWFPTPGRIWEQLRAFCVMIGFIVFFLGYVLVFLIKSEVTEQTFRVLLRQQRVIHVTAPGPVLLAITVAIALALAAVAFMLSERVLEGMPLRPKSPDSPARQAGAALPPRMVGLLAPWVHLASRAALITILWVAGLALLACMMRLGGVPAGDKDIAFVVLVPMLFAPVLLLLGLTGVWTGCMRALRMLPLSQAQITALILSLFVISLAIASAGLLLLARFAGGNAPLHAILNYSVSFLAWGCASLVLLVRFGGAGTFLGMLVLWGIPAYTWTASARNGATSVAISLIMAAVAIASTAMLYRVIGHSSGAYRRKPALEEGPFGQP